MTCYNLALLNPTPLISLSYTPKYPPVHFVSIKNKWTKQKNTLFMSFFCIVSTLCKRGTKWKVTAASSKLLQFRFWQNIPPLEKITEKKKSPGRKRNWHATAIIEFSEWSESWRKRKENMVHEIKSICDYPVAMKSLASNRLKGN